jgi:hypothetical protein
LGDSDFLMALVLPPKMVRIANKNAASQTLRKIIARRALFD